MRTTFLLLCAALPLTTLAQAKKKPATKPPTTVAYDTAWCDGNFDEIPAARRREAVLFAVRKREKAPGPIRLVTVYTAADRKKLASGFTKNDSTMVGVWSVFYPTGQKLGELQYDDQGNEIEYARKIFTPDGTNACAVVQAVVPITSQPMSNALASDSRLAIPVTLPAHTAVAVITFDIRDADAPTPLWRHLLTAGEMLTTGGISYAFTAVNMVLQMNAAQVSQIDPDPKAPNPGTTKSLFFVTADSAQAFAFRANGISDAPGPHFYGPSKVNQEQTKLLVDAGDRPTRVWLCVENYNIVTDATATVAVEAVIDYCSTQSSQATKAAR